LSARAKKVKKEKPELQSILFHFFFTKCKKSDSLDFIQEKSRAPRDQSFYAQLGSLTNESSAMSLEGANRQTGSCTTHIRI